MIPATDRRPPCRCEACSPVSPALDGLCLAAGALAFILLPGRALLQLAGIL